MKIITAPIGLARRLHCPSDMMKSLRFMILVLGSVFLFSFDALAGRYAVFKDTKSHYLVLKTDGSIYWGSPQEMFEVEILSAAPSRGTDITVNYIEPRLREIQSFTYHVRNNMVSLLGPTLLDGSRRAVVLSPTDIREYHLVVERLEQGKTKIQKNRDDSLEIVLKPFGGMDRMFYIRHEKGPPFDSVELSVGSNNEPFRKVPVINFHQEGMTLFLTYYDATLGVVTLEIGDQRFTTQSFVRTTRSKKVFYALGQSPLDEAYQIRNVPFKKNEPFRTPYEVFRTSDCNVHLAIQIPKIIIH